MNRRNPMIAAAVALIALPVAAQEPAQQSTLYVVGYAHLDTQWRWTYPQTIREYLAHTLHDNFKLFEEHPAYVFNFTGARRYQMFKEYFPEEYARLKGYVAAGRWFPAGSSVDENDANTPSGESLVRNVLYGNQFFRHEFGVASEEYMLPDCFGFPAALPSVLAHCGVKGFSTQKLTWGSVVGIPFNVGVWNGPDGRGVIAALNPGQYDGDVTENQATSASWQKRILENGVRSGLLADFRYYGTGDVGGAPKEASVSMMDQSLATSGPIKVVAGAADELFKTITPAQREKLPHYKGELELTEHSAGSATSQAYMKRWNRKNELLANAAESASVIAAWLGARDYPAQKLEDAWTLVLGSQMHDIISGTALAKGYEYAWNDEVLAANQFCAVLCDAVEVAASALDTRGDGQALVLFNPLSIERQDVVEAQIAGDSVGVKGVSVSGPDGRAVPAQILGAASNNVRIAFLARVPSVGFAVYHARLSNSETRVESALRVEERRLENERYVVTLDADGNVASIKDKVANTELLSAPARLELCYENPKNWPAWNQDWTDRQLPPREIVGGPARVEIVERGPARVAIQVTRETNGSIFVQRIRLSGGAAAARIEFDTQIDWNSRERSLRAAFPLVARNPLATYDCQSGVVERGNRHAKQYEYGFQQWFDLTDAKGSSGVSVMSDCKYGADKPDDGTLRLTLLHTPGTHGGYEDQGTQDLGRHRVLYALSGHAGDWRKGKTALEAARLNQPLIPFRATAHDGALGKSFSLFQTSSDEVSIQAIKKAEASNAIVVRLRELSGRAQKDLRLMSSAPITSAREVDGQEREIAVARTQQGALVCEIGGFELRAFALDLGAAPAAVRRPISLPLALDFDSDVASAQANRAEGAFDAQGGSLPAEQLPRRIVAGDATFELGPTDGAAKNALACRGQQLALPQAPSGDVDRLYLLAASDGSSGQIHTSVEVDGHPVAIDVQAWTGMIGQWDRRIWRGDQPEQAFGWSNPLAGVEPGFVEPATVAWFCSHHHQPKGDAFYQYSYLYKIAIDLPQGAKSLRLPNDPRVKLLALTAVGSGPRLQPAAPLFDTLEDHVQDAPRVVPASGSFRDVVMVSIDPRLFWRDGRVRYTLDGSEPSANSTTYTGPFVLDHRATIKAAVLDAQGGLGPVVAAELDVDDVTPPTVSSVRPAYGSPLVRVEFSEPVGDSALETANFVLEPALALRSAKRAEGARSVVLEFAAPPEIGRAYALKIKGVSDASPARNTLKSASIDMQVNGPVFERAEVARELMGGELRDVKGLPVQAGDAWTLNMFVRTDKQPEDRTLIAGFGRCEQTVDGVARYMAKFPRGIQFWSHNRDVVGRTPLDLGRWQMLSATYDGRTLRVYKDGVQLAQRDLALAADENSVHFAPIDPWEHKRRFEGEIRSFTIWGEALGEDALRSLLQSDTEH